jgi:hypothetical protein
MAKKFAIFMEFYGLLSLTKILRAIPVLHTNANIPPTHQSWFNHPITE